MQKLSLIFIVSEKSRAIYFKIVNPFTSGLFV